MRLIELQIVSIYQSLPPDATGALPYTPLGGDKVPWRPSVPNLPPKFQTLATLLVVDSGVSRNLKGSEGIFPVYIFKSAQILAYSSR